MNDTATVMADRLLLLGGLERNKVVANRNELKRFLRAYFGAPKQSHQESSEIARPDAARFALQISIAPRPVSRPEQILHVKPRF